MPPWFLRPFPVPVSAPSLVGFITANALLCSVCLFVGLFAPRLGVVLGVSPFLRTPGRWITGFLVITFVGLAIMRLWGTLAEIPTDLAWSAVYYTVFTALHLALGRLAKRRSHIVGNRRS
jgi:hypothetical protein